MHTALCTLHTAHCTLHTACYTLHATHCTVHTTNCTLLHTVHCWACTVEHCKLFIVAFIFCSQRDFCCHFLVCFYSLYIVIHCLNYYFIVKLECPLSYSANLSALVEGFSGGQYNPNTQIVLLFVSILNFK